MTTASAPGVVKRGPILGLRGKLFALLFALNLLLTSAFAFVLYDSLREGIVEEIDDGLLAVAHGVHEMIPPAYFDRVARHETIPDDEYLALVTRLTDYARTCKLAYLYAVLEDGGAVVEAVTSADDADFRAGTFERPLTPYPSASHALRLTLGDSVMRNDSYADAYGEFRSVYLPGRTPQGQVYVIGVDTPLTDMTGRLNRAMFLTIALGLVGFVLSCGLGGLAVARVIRPLKELTRFARQTKANNFTLVGEGLSGIFRLGASVGDEISELSQAMREMLSALNRYIVELKSANAARARLESEFEAAHDIQQGMVPHAPPEFPTWSRVTLAASVEPAKAVGGDLYDYFLIGEDRLFFVVGDVSGKGLPAALFMAITCTLFRTFAAQDLLLDEVMRRANRYLVDNNPSAMFVTVFAGILDLRSGRVVYADGGHEPPLIVHTDGSAEALRKVGGMALGFMEVPFVTGSFDLAPGEALVLFTDGVTEAMNPAGELFTQAAVLRALAEGQGPADAATMLARLLDRVHAHAGGAEPHDDVTILTICFDGVG
ncbi:MAG: SpoIIE family protein phosphatase [Ancalomicrobiaceae bacterium]|nr:SpoIIE family protein phosphatase [Ancalomicrobiaceae bacterium]